MRGAHRSGTSLSVLEQRKIDVQGCHTVLGPADPRVADYRSLPDPQFLRTRGLFVAEGRLVVQRLLASARFETRSVLVTATALASLRPVLESRRDPIEVLVASGEMLVEIAGFNFHRGCLALGLRPRDPHAPPQPPSDPASTIVVLEGLSQADNVGSVFRNAAAFGARAVVLDGACCDPLYRKALRTSMGTVLDVPFSRAMDLAAELRAFQGAGYRLVALTPSADAQPIERFSRADDCRIALLVGAEGNGLSPRIEAMADNRITIPMAAGVDSLNVATAAGIALHRLRSSVIGSGPLARS